MEVKISKSALTILVVLLVLFFSFSLGSLYFLLIRGDSAETDQISQNWEEDIQISPSELQEDYSGWEYVVTQQGIVLFNVEIEEVAVEEDLIVIDMAITIEEKEVLLRVKSESFNNVLDFVLRESTEENDYFDSVDEVITVSNASSIEASPGWIVIFDVDAGEVDAVDYLEKLAREDSSERFELGEEFELYSLRSSEVSI